MASMASSMALKLVTASSPAASAVGLDGGELDAHVVAEPGHRHQPAAPQVLARAGPPAR